MTIYGFANTLLNGARERAAVKRLPFTITLPWLVERLKPRICEVTGIEFDFSRANVAYGAMNPFAPSVDRKVPSLGYTEENTQIVVWLYNAAKGSWTDADVLKMAQALVARKPSILTDLLLTCQAFYALPIQLLPCET